MQDHGPWRLCLCSTREPITSTKKPCRRRRESRNALELTPSKKVIHNPELLGPHSEQLGLVAPGDWVDFFRYVAESYSGVILPEGDDRDLKGHIIPKVMAAKDRFDVNFVRDYQPPEVGDWLDSENTLPGPLEPYFLRANTGPRHILGGVMSRPFIFASQSAGKFAITSLESSSAYGRSPLAEKWLTFQSVDHCFCVQEGLLRVKLKKEGADTEWTEVREGQTVLVPAGQGFILDFGSRYVRTITFTNGRGLEELIKLAGKDCPSVVLPEEAAPFDPEKLQDACSEVKLAMENL